MTPRLEVNLRLCTRDMEIVKKQRVWSSASKFWENEISVTRYGQNSVRDLCSRVNNCEELLYIYFFIPQFKYMISYIHNFTFIFPGYTTNQFNDQLPVGLLSQLVRTLHRYRRGQGSNPGKPDFFRLSFRNCISCVNNCEDLIYI